MSKFSGPNQMRPNVTSSLSTTEQRLPTYEGGDGFAKTAETELFQLAVTNMVSEDTFYESASVRDKRFEKLVHEVTRSNPGFIAGSDPAAGKVGLAAYLRDTMNMRSASLVLAAEYVKAGGPNGRKVVYSALQRADEPGEMVGYWLARHGRQFPAALKRGIADACTKLYNEHSLLKYDGQSKGVRFADVIDLVHPKPANARQSDLFRHALDRRHNRANEIPTSLGQLVADQYLRMLPEDQRRSAIGGNAWNEAGWTWERLSGWIPGGMDAQAWEAVLPKMGYMARLRNLRNFESAGIGQEWVSKLQSDLADPEQVAKSHQFPFRFLSAYKATNSLTFAHSLERALELSTQNVPVLEGGSLVLIDVSGSMTTGISGKSQMRRCEVAALGAACFAKRNKQADLVAFDHVAREINMMPNESVLRYMDRVASISTGGATRTWEAINRFFDPQRHKRVIVFTDEQTADNDTGRKIPLLHIFNLAGYRTAMTSYGSQGRYTYGGFTDSTFALMKLLEDQKPGIWPF